MEIMSTQNHTKNLKPEGRLLFTNMQKLLLLMLMGIMGYATSYSQTDPKVWVRFANPVYDCADSTYCLDVQMQSDSANIELFQINMRFFFDPAVLEYDKLTNFQGGYKERTNANTGISTGNAASGQIVFGFSGAASYGNLIVDIGNKNQAIAMSNNPSVWTTYYQICFKVKSIADSSKFCPVVIWEQQPAQRGGIRSGSDGIVVRAIDLRPGANPDDTRSLEEIGIHYNYLMPFQAFQTNPLMLNFPLGRDTAVTCINIFCPPAPDTTYVTIPPGGTDTVCVESFLEFGGDYDNVAMCANAPNLTEKLVAVNGDTCVEITTDPGFVGSDTTCVIHCYDTLGMSVCDTTVIVVTTNPQPNLSMQKIVVSGPTATLNPNEYSMDYHIIARNIGTASGTYDVFDTLRYGTGISISSATATYIGGDGNQGTIGSFSGGIALVSDDEMLAQGQADTFNVNVVFTISAQATPQSRNCILETGETGTGLMNTASLRDSSKQVNDTACVHAPDPTGSIGDYVWTDDGDGIQESGENGLPGVVVILYDGAGVELGRDTTDANGAYKFDNLLPGNYSVGFEAPTGHDIAPAGQGGDNTKDSDPNPTTGKTSNFTLAAGEDKTDIDAGMVPHASISDFVWEDTNGDGDQDTGENGKPGVVVVLYDDMGTEIARDTTDGNGNYSFDQLLPGDYSVGIELPAGYISSPLDQGGDDAKDSDIDPATGETATINLTAGENDDSVDAGLVPTGSIGDMVWEDTDGDGIQDPGETSGIPGVIVTLYDDMGTEVAKDTTDSNGNYLFRRCTSRGLYPQLQHPYGSDVESPRSGRE